MSPTGSDIPEKLAPNKPPKISPTASAQQEILWGPGFASAAKSGVFSCCREKQAQTYKPL